MVDVGEKITTQRVAVAEGQITFTKGILRSMLTNGSPKGDIFTTAKLAGIMAAKRTAEFIPLCHSLPLSFVDVQFEARDTENRILVRVEARTTSQTGVEMEALTAAAIALLTLYDMTKSADKKMTIGKVRLVYKAGGKSGIFRNDAESKHRKATKAQS